MPSFRQVYGWRAPALAAMMAVLGGCALSPVQNEADALAKAAADFKVASTASSPVPAADAVVAKSQFLAMLVSGRAGLLYTGCDKETGDFNQALVGAAPADEAHIFQGFSRIAPCGERQRSGSSAPPPAGQPAIDAVNDYFAGLNAVVAAKDSAEVSSAAQKLTASLQALASTAHASAPVAEAPGFLGKLADLALRQAQYEALRQAVLRADPLFDDAAPALAGALRLRQGLWAKETADDAASATALINAALDAPAVREAPGLRLDVYRQASPLLDALQQAQASATRDPENSVQALVEAHHQLAAALKDNRRQTQTVFDAVVEIAGAGRALASAQ